MQQKHKIELLAPAKNRDCAFAAIDHGADAVYIGGPAFGARSAAPNSINDITLICEYAHLFNVKVYIALNTILYDNEIEQAVKIAHEVYRAGADALIIQDMGLLECDLPPIEIHASTQTNNQTPEKVKFLENVGFSQVVLARELNIKQIRDIRRSTHIPLEYFVHGALCVSYSGQCYISEFATGRSANRGQCAQFCRHKWTLKDRDNKIIEKDKYLLSLNDLNNSNNLESLIDAGISSFKIEGRLKDVEYVKNITAYYRQKLDEIIGKRDDLLKSSIGKVDVSFTPNPFKSFNRGATDYYLNKPKNKCASVNTPKSTGEYIGTIQKIGGNYFELDSNKDLTNGDGLCFFSSKGEQGGMLVNKVESNKVYPNSMPQLKTGSKLYRNYDIAFNKALNNSSSTRKIGLTLSLDETDSGIKLIGQIENGYKIEIEKCISKDIALNPKKAYDTIKKQLSKLGNTPFYLDDIDIKMKDPIFIQASVLNDLRRYLCEKIKITIVSNYKRQPIKHTKTSTPWINSSTSYLDNIANEKAKKFYNRHRVESPAQAFEIQPPNDKAVLMHTKYCIKYELGLCPSEPEAKQINIKEPLYISDNTGTYELRFDCKKCEMMVFSKKVNHNANKLSN